MRQWEIQKSIYDELLGYYPLTSMVEDRIYDHVPQNTVYPYVSIGDDTSVAWDTDLDNGSETTLTIHVWSRMRGRREVKEVMQQIYAALHKTDLSIVGAHTVFCHFDFSESLLDSDGITRHGVIRFRIIVDNRPES